MTANVAHLSNDGLVEFPSGAPGIRTWIATRLSMITGLNRSMVHAGEIITERSDSVFAALRPPAPDWHSIARDLASAVMVGHPTDVQEAVNAYRVAAGMAPWPWDQLASPVT